MKYLKLAIVSASIGCVTSAFAGAGIVTTTVKPLANNVTYSTGGTKPLVTLIGYEVKIGSDASNSNTINNIVFTGTASATDTAEKPTFDSADGATCTTTNADPTTVRCSIGQLRAGQSFPPFVVFFKAPVQVKQEPPALDDAEGEDKVSFAGTTYYAEGTGGEPQSTPSNSTVAWGATPSVTLGTTSATILKSAASKFGANLWTGNGTFPTAVDPWLSIVRVPGLPTGQLYVTTVIDETPTAPLSTCIGCRENLTTKLRIPEDETAPRQIFQGMPGDKDSGWLQMELLRDASLNVGLNIKFAKIYYLPDGLNQQFVEILSCAVGWPSDGNDVPCIYDRKQFKNNDPTVELRGDWWFLLIMRHNLRVQM